MAACFLVLRVTLTVTLVTLIIGVSALGGLLNRCRGGLCDLRALTYWPEQLVSRLVFAVPSGILVVSGILHIL